MNKVLAILRKERAQLEKFEALLLGLNAETRRTILWLNGEIDDFEEDGDREFEEF